MFINGIVVECTMKTDSIKDEFENEVIEELIEVKERV